MNMSSIAESKAGRAIAKSQNMFAIVEHMEGVRWMVEMGRQCPWKEVRSSTLSSALDAFRERGSDL